MYLKVLRLIHPLKHNTLFSNDQIIVMGNSKLVLNAWQKLSKTYAHMHTNTYIQETLVTLK